MKQNKQINIFLENMQANSQGSKKEKIQSKHYLFDQKHPTNFSEFGAVFFIRLQKSWENGGFWRWWVFFSHSKVGDLHGPSWTPTFTTRAQLVEGDRPARCPNHFFAVNEPSAVPWWWCFVLWSEVFWCLDVCCGVRSCDGHVIWCDVMACVVSCHVMQCDVMVMSCTTSCSTTPHSKMPARQFCTATHTCSPQKASFVGISGARKSTVPKSSRSEDLVAQIEAIDSRKAFKLEWRSANGSSAMYLLRTPNKPIKDIRSITWQPTKQNNKLELW